MWVYVSMCIWTRRRKIHVKLPTHYYEMTISHLNLINKSSTHHHHHRVRDRESESYILMLPLGSTSHITFIITSNKYQCKPILWSLSIFFPFFCFPLLSHATCQKKFHHPVGNFRINETHERNWSVNIIYLIAFIILRNPIGKWSQRVCVQSPIYSVAAGRFEFSVKYYNFCVLYIFFLGLNYWDFFQWAHILNSNPFNRMLDISFYFVVARKVIECRIKWAWSAVNERRSLFGHHHAYSFINVVNASSCTWHKRGAKHRTKSKSKKKKFNFFFCVPCAIFRTQIFPFFDNFGNLVDTGSWLKWANRRRKEKKTNKHAHKSCVNAGRRS